MLCSTDLFYFVCVSVCARTRFFFKHVWPREQDWVLPVSRAMLISHALIPALATDHPSLPTTLHPLRRRGTRTCTHKLARALYTLIRAADGESAFGRALLASRMLAHAYVHIILLFCVLFFCFLHISVHPRAPTQRNRKHEQMQPYALAFTRHTNHDGSSGGKQLSFCDARRNLEKKIVLCRWFLVHFTQLHVQNECFTLTINAKVDSCKNNCFSIKTGNNIHTLLFTLKLKVWQDFKIPD